jgi:hypothetical protein
VELNIINEVATLERLSVGQLRQRFADLFGETTKASNRTWLVKRIAWRLQALAEGDLSERARRRAAELARDADLRLNPPQSKSTTATPPPPEAVSMPAPVDHRLPPAGFPKPLLLLTSVPVSFVPCRQRRRTGDLSGVAVFDTAKLFALAMGATTADQARR